MHVMIATQCLFIPSMVNNPLSEVGLHKYLGVYLLNWDLQIFFSPQDSNNIQRVHGT